MALGLMHRGGRNKSKYQRLEFKDCSSYHGKRKKNWIAILSISSSMHQEFMAMPKYYGTIIVTGQASIHQEGITAERHNPRFGKKELSSIVLAIEKNSRSKERMDSNT